MSFWETALSSSLGAFVGFLGALIIYFIKEFRSRVARQKAVVSNLKYELTYNINLYSKFEGQIQDCIEAISNDSHDTYLSLDYDFIARHFARQFYNEGILPKYFHPEDVRRWNIVLSSVSDGSQAYVIESVEKWREQNIEKEKVFKSLKHEKTQVAYAREMSEYILKKL